MCSRHRRLLPGSTAVRRLDQRVVGEIRADKTLQKHVVGSKHLLRWLNGWAFDESILKQARVAGVEFVRVIDEESKTTYWARLDDFFQHGVAFNHGCGEQIGLGLECWQVGTQRPTPAVQMGLFEAATP